jgi:lysophospholipase L1-like esterase
MVSLLARPSNVSSPAEVLKLSRNWVFLGDSLTEGVGSKRINYVTELVNQLRGGAPDVNVHEFRLRRIDMSTFNRDIEFNVAGLMNTEARPHASDLWLWNLACEGETIDSDFRWLPLITAVRPELVVVFRGSLESIVRPAMVLDGDWPWWVPGSWRGYAAMDPRCYFSRTWWRKAKQTSFDAMKQKVRFKLLRVRPGKPLIDLDRLAQYQTDLLKRLRELDTRVLVLGLLPVEQARFPGSPEYFKVVNARLEEIAAANGAEFFDWGSRLSGNGDLFCRDSFHPNLAGARALAEILQERVLQTL